MNIQQARELFNCQYYGQNVFMFSNIPSNEIDELRILTGDLLIYKKSYLLLRTVNQLTDEEICAIGNYLRPEYFFTIERPGKHIKIVWADNYVFTIYDDLSFGFYELKPFYEESEIKDTLRLFGVLVSFTYLSEENNQPVTLQPDEIIAKGWAKIKE